MRFNTCVHKCSSRRQSPLPPQAHGHAPRVAPLETVARWLLHASAHHGARGRMAICSCGSVGNCGINTALPWLCHWGWALCGELWLNTALPWLCHWGWAVRGTVGSCSCPLPIPRLYPRLWTGVGALRTWRRAVPVWGLEWCRASGDYGRAPLVVGGAWCAAARCRCLATASPAHATRTGSGNPWRMIDVFSRVFSVQ